MIRSSLAVCSLAALTGTAAPVVTDLVVSQDPSRIVTVSYTLSEKAIVTMEAFTNGVSIGFAPIANATGDVNVRVDADRNRRILWDPTQTWPNRKIKDGSFSVRLTAWALDNPPDYMIVDLRSGDLRWYPSAEAVPGGITSDAYKTEKLAMRHIRAAGVRWRMGNSFDETANNTHDVILTNDYYIGVYKVTVSQHNAICGTSYSGGKKAIMGVAYSAMRGASPTYDWPGKRHLVDPDSTSGKLNKLTGLAFDLPTEAQWEFACRGGTADNHIGFADVTDVAWSKESGVAAVQEVGLRQPNGFGLYDPLGNGFDFCLDWYTADYNGAPKGGLAIEPEGPAGGDLRVIRNGSVKHAASCEHREGFGEAGEASTVGYRLACSTDMH